LSPWAHRNLPAFIGNGGDGVGKEIVKDPFDIEMKNIEETQSRVSRISRPESWSFLHFPLFQVFEKF